MDSDNHNQGLPLLSTATVAGLSIIYTILYVAPFYLSPLTRPSPTLSRDDPTVIRARIRSVARSCTVTSLITVSVIQAYLRGPFWHRIASTLHFLGWYPLGNSEITQSLFLTALLFAGPLLERVIIDGNWREWMWGRRMYECLSTWIGWRNFVAGPLTEELVFRSLLVPLSLLSHLPPTHLPLSLSNFPPTPSSSSSSSSSIPLPPSALNPTIFLTPLYFGIAHIHHFYETTLTHPDIPVFPHAVLATIAQFLYTTLFGWYATFIFVRTGSFAAVVVCHAFCNWMGLPRVWGRVWGVGVRRWERGEGRKTATSMVEVEWTAMYYMTLLAGVIAFSYGFWPLTRSERGLVIGF